MLDIRKPGGARWGVNWVRYLIGHSDATGQPLDVAISLPRGDEMVSQAEVFDAEEGGAAVHELPPDRRHPARIDDRTLGHLPPHLLS